MTTERTLSGGWRISTIHGGHLVSRLYLGYTKAEAKREFRAELRSM